MEIYYNMLDKIKKEEKEIVFLLSNGFLNIYSLYTFKEFYYNCCKNLKDIIDTMSDKEENRNSYIELFQKIKSVGNFINELEENYRNGNNIDVNQIKNYLVSQNPLNKENKVEQQKEEKKSVIKRDVEEVKELPIEEIKPVIKTSIEDKKELIKENDVVSFISGTEKNIKEKEEIESNTKEAKLLLDQMKKELLKRTEQEKLRAQILSTLTKKTTNTYDYGYDDNEVEVASVNPSYKRAA